MSAFEDLQAAWPAIEQRFMASAPVRRVIAAEIGIDHYAAYLRETYFYTREDPQIQAAVTLQFRGAEREMVGPFLQHARSEVGHDQLALNDLASLGFDTSEVSNQQPLPATELLCSYPIAGLMHRPAVSYLGYLFFLEFVPTSQGEAFSGALLKAGVPSGALTFLKEHQDIDVHHNRLMKVYAECLIQTSHDLETVVASMQVTARAFAAMLEDAFDSIDMKTTTLRRLSKNATVRA